MKTKILWLGSMFALCVQMQPARAADPVLEAFQRGLFEEEANGNPAGAVQAYQGVLQQLEEQRKLAGTVLFRLGECYRKLGRTNDAVQAYQQLLREHPSLDTLATLARQNLAGLGVDASLPQPAGSETPEEDELARLQRMLRDSPDLVNAAGPDGTPLTQAAGKGDLRAAAFLLDHGALVDKPGLGVTPLGSAVGQGHNTMVELLLSRGADENARSSGQTPLFLAAERGYVAVAQTLLKHGADLELKSSADGSLGHMTPLQTAVVSDHEPMVRALLEHGADVNALSQRHATRPQPNGTALHWAAKSSKLLIMNALVENGADPNALNDLGQTPLHVAAERKDEELVARLLAAGANPNLAVKEGEYATWTPLHYAVFRGADTPTMKRLLEAGADVDAVAQIRNMSCRDYTPLLLLAARTRAEDPVPAAKLLLEFKANVEFTNPCGVNPLLAAVQNPNEVLAALLLNHGASPNVRDNEGTPVLQAAASLAMATLLLDHGADPNATNSTGGTLLHHLVLLVSQPLQLPGRASVNREAVALAQLVIEKGANVNARHAGGYTPLNLLGIPAKPGTETQKALAQLLLQNGAVDAALEPLPDPESIRVWRSDRVVAQVAFKTASQDWNRYTLLETMFVHLFSNAGTSLTDPLSVAHRDLPRQLSDVGLPFPDLANVIIHRNAAGLKTNLFVNLIDPANGKIDCSKDVWLEFGDLVELPEREHALGDDWTKLKGEIQAQLGACVRREIKIVFREEELVHTLVWPTCAGEFLRSDAAGLRKLLTTSADLSRVKVRRQDPISGEPVEYTLNAVTAQRPEDLLLRDGDIIVVPEKPE